MAESLPKVAPSPEQTPPTGSALDPKAILGAFVAVLTKPAKFFATSAISAQKGYGRPLVFAVVMGIFARVFDAIDEIHRSHLTHLVDISPWLGIIILSPIESVLGAFILGAMIHVLGGIARAKATYEQSVRIACYALAVWPIARALNILLPLLIKFPVAVVRHNLGVIPELAYIYGLYVVALGLVALEAANRRTTFIVCGMLAIIGLIWSVVGSHVLWALFGGI